MTGITIDVQANIDQAQKSLTSVEKSVSDIHKVTKKATDAFSAMGKSLMASFSAAAIITTLTKVDDTFVNLEGKIKLVTKSTEDFSASYVSLKRVSDETRASFADTSDVFARLGSAMSNTNVGSDQLIKAAKTLQMAGAISGNSGESFKAAMMQLGQGLGSGALRGEEFNSILEQALPVAQLLADSLNVSVGSLKAMTNEGKLTTDIVFSSLLSQAQDVEEKFKKMGPTLGQSFAKLRENIALLINELNQNFKISSNIAAPIAKLNEGISKLLKEVPVLSAKMAIFWASWAPRVSDAFYPFVHGFKLALNIVKTLLAASGVGKFFINMFIIVETTVKTAVARMFNYLENSGKMLKIIDNKGILGVVDLVKTLPDVFKSRLGLAISEWKGFFKAIAAVNTTKFSMIFSAIGNGLSAYINLAGGQIVAGILDTKLLSIGLVKFKQIFVMGISATIDAIKTLGHNIKYSEFDFITVPLTKLGDTLKFIFGEELINSFLKFTSKLPNISFVIETLLGIVFPPLRLLLSIIGNLQMVGDGINISFNANLFAASFNFVMDKLRAVKDFLVTAALDTKFGSAIYDFFLDLKNLDVDTFLESIGNAFSKLGTRLNIKLNFSYVKAFFDGILEKSTILTKVVNAISAFGAKVIEVFRLVWDAVIGHSWWTDTIESIHNTSQNLLGRPISNIKAFAGKVIDFFKGLYQSVVRFFTEIRSTTIIIDTSSANEKFEAIKKLFYDMRDAAETVGTIIADVFRRLTTKDGFKDFDTTELQAKLVKLSEVVSTALSNAVTNIKLVIDYDGFQAAVADLRSTVEGFTKTLGTTLENKAKMFAKALVEATSEFAKEHIFPKNIKEKDGNSPVGDFVAKANKGLEQLRKAWDDFNASESMGEAVGRFLGKMVGTALALLVANAPAIARELLSFLSGFGRGLLEGLLPFGGIVEDIFKTLDTAGVGSVSGLLITYLFGGKLLSTLAAMGIFRKQLTAILSIFSSVGAFFSGRTTHAAGGLLESLSRTMFGAAGGRRLMSLGMASVALDMLGVFDGVFAGSDIAHGIFTALSIGLMTTGAGLTALLKTQIETAIWGLAIQLDSAGFRALSDKILTFLVPNLNPQSIWSRLGATLLSKLETVFAFVSTRAVALSTAGRGLTDALIFGENIGPHAASWKTAIVSAIDGTVNAIFRTIGTVTKIKPMWDSLMVHLSTSTTRTGIFSNALFGSGGVAGSVLRPLAIASAAILAFTMLTGFASQDNFIRDKEGKIIGVKDSSASKKDDKKPEGYPRVKMALESIPDANPGVNRVMKAVGELPPALVNATAAGVFTTFLFGRVGVVGNILRPIAAIISAITAFALTKGPDSFFEKIGKSFKSLFGLYEELGQVGYDSLHNFEELLKSAYKIQAAYAKELIGGIGDFITSNSWIKGYLEDSPRAVAAIHGVISAWRSMVDEIKKVQKSINDSTVFAFQYFPQTSLVAGVGALSFIISWLSRIEAGTNVMKAFTLQASAMFAAIINFRRLGTTAKIVSGIGTLATVGAAYSEYSSYKGEGTLSEQLNNAKPRVTSESVSQAASQAVQKQVDDVKTSVEDISNVLDTATKGAAAAGTAGTLIGKLKLIGTVLFAIKTPLIILANAVLHLLPLITVVATAVWWALKKFGSAIKYLIDSGPAIWEWIKSIGRALKNISFADITAKLASLFKTLSSVKMFSIGIGISIAYGATMTYLRGVAEDGGNVVINTFLDVLSNGKVLLVAMLGSITALISSAFTGAMVDGIFTGTIALLAWPATLMGRLLPTFASIGFGMAGQLLGEFTANVVFESPKLEALFGGIGFLLGTLMTRGIVKAVAAWAMRVGVVVASIWGFVAVAAAGLIMQFTGVIDVFNRWDNVLDDITTKLKQLTGHKDIVINTRTGLTEDQQQTLDTAGIPVNIDMSKVITELLPRSLSNDLEAARTGMVDKAAEANSQAALGNTEEAKAALDAAKNSRRLYEALAKQATENSFVEFIPAMIDKLNLGGKLTQDHFWTANKDKVWNTPIDVNTPNGSMKEMLGETVVDSKGVYTTTPGLIQKDAKLAAITPEISSALTEMYAKMFLSVNKIRADKDLLAKGASAPRTEEINADIAKLTDILSGDVKIVKDLMEQRAQFVKEREAVNKGSHANADLVSSAKTASITIDPDTFNFSKSAAEDIYALTNAIRYLREEEKNTGDELSKGRIKQSIKTLQEDAKLIIERNTLLSTSPQIAISSLQDVAGFSFPKSISNLTASQTMPALEGLRQIKLQKAEMGLAAPYLPTKPEAGKRDWIPGAPGLAKDLAAYKTIEALKTNIEAFQAGGDAALKGPRVAIAEKIQSAISENKSVADQAIGEALSSASVDVANSIASHIPLDKIKSVGKELVRLAMLKELFADDLVKSSSITKEIAALSASIKGIDPTPIKEMVAAFSTKLAPEDLQIMDVAQLEIVKSAFIDIANINKEITKQSTEKGLDWNIEEQLALYKQLEDKQKDVAKVSREIAMKSGTRIMTSLKSTGGEAQRSNVSSELLSSISKTENAIADLMAARGEAHGDNVLDQIRIYDKAILELTNHLESLKLGVESVGEANKKTFEALGLSSASQQALASPADLFKASFLRKRLESNKLKVSQGDTSETLLADIAADQSSLNALQRTADKTGKAVSESLSAVGFDKDILNIPMQFRTSALAIDKQIKDLRASLEEKGAEFAPGIMATIQGLEQQLKELQIVGITTGDQLQSAMEAIGLGSLDRIATATVDSIERASVYAKAQALLASRKALYTTPAQLIDYAKESMILDKLMSRAKILNSTFADKFSMIGEAFGSSVSEIDFFKLTDGLQEALLQTATAFKIAMEDSLRKGTITDDLKNLYRVKDKLANKMQLIAFSTELRKSTEEGMNLGAKDALSKINSTLGETGLDLRSFIGLPAAQREELTKQASAKSILDKAMFDTSLKLPPEAIDVLNKFDGNNAPEIVKELSDTLQNVGKSLSGLLSTPTEKLADVQERAIVALQENTMALLGKALPKPTDTAAPSRVVTESVVAKDSDFKGSAREVALKLLPGLIHVESRGKDDAISIAGAQGRTQVMPATGRNPGYGIKPMQGNSPQEFERFAVDYLTKMLEVNNGNVDRALSAYNQGPGGLARRGIINQGYVDAVKRANAKHLGKVTSAVVASKPSTPEVTTLPVQEYTPLAMSFKEPTPVKVATVSGDFERSLTPSDAVQKAFVKPIPFLSKSAALSAVVKEHGQRSAISEHKVSDIPQVDTRVAQLMDSVQLSKATTYLSNIASLNDTLAKAIEDKTPTAHLRKQIDEQVYQLERMTSAIEANAIAVREAGKAFESAISSSFKDAFKGLLNGDKMDDMSPLRTFAEKLMNSVKDNVLESFTNGMMKASGFGEGGAVQGMLQKTGETVYSGVVGGLEGLGSMATGKMSLSEAGSGIYSWFSGLLGGDSSTTSGKPEVVMMSAANKMNVAADKMLGIGGAGSIGGMSSLARSMQGLSGIFPSSAAGTSAFGGKDVKVMMDDSFKALGDNFTRDFSKDVLNSDTGVFSQGNLTEAGNAMSKFNPTTGNFDTMSAFSADVAGGLAPQGLKTSTENALSMDSVLGKGAGTGVAVDESIFKGLTDKFTKAFENIDWAGMWGQLTGQLSQMVGQVGKMMPSFAATGGHVVGPGSGTSDSIPMMLSNGEFVVNAKATKANLALLHGINSGNPGKMATGGLVSASAAMMRTPTYNEANVITRSNKDSSQQQVINVNITGDISRQTKSEIYKMMPSIADGVNSQNKERGYRR
jgi:tape measure domain-containing protein